MWHSRTPGAAWRERRDAGGELTAKGVALIRHDVMDQDGNGVWTTPGGDQVEGTAVRVSGLRKRFGLVGLAEQAGTRIAALSGGQARRVDAALGVIGRPVYLAGVIAAFGVAQSQDSNCWLLAFAICPQCFYLLPFRQAMIPVVGLNVLAASLLVYQRPQLDPAVAALATAALRHRLLRCLRRLRRPGHRSEQRARRVHRPAGGDPRRARRHQPRVGHPRRAAAAGRGNP